jgi:O-antigen biosynthesis protein WbqP
MKYRILDLFISLLLLPIIFLILIIVFIFFNLYQCNGSFIYKTKRIGLNNNIFIMYKIRTMNTRAPELASHLLDNPHVYINKFQSFLRRYSIDELPQIFNVIIGDLSIVGPRPALYNQYDLINIRKKYNIHTIRPGITGLSQVYFRDSISINNKVKIDKIYINNKSLCFDLYLVLKTIFTITNTKNVSH